MKLPLLALDGGLTLDNGWTRRDYSVFRVLFGLYLVVHFVQLLPAASDLFSSAGMLSRAKDSPLAILPNPLVRFDQPWQVQLFVGLGVVLAVAFTTGVGDRVCAVLLWGIWACLHARNPLIGNPGLPYVGWILLAHAVIAPRRRDPDWRFPADVFAVAWLLMALGYTYSGLTKLAGPSWLDGSAVRCVLDNPLARPGMLRTWLLALPPWCLQLATWTTLAVEISALPLALVRRVRPYLWLGFLLFHLALIALIDFADLSLGMVMLHAFTVDPAWLPHRQWTTGRGRLESSAWTTRAPLARPS